MRNPVVAALAGAVALTAGSAFAADLAAPVAPRAALAASYKSTPFNWSGLYFGVNGGYGTGTTNGDMFTSNFGQIGNYGIAGGLLGGQVGFNHQSGNLVLGVEANWDWANVDGSHGYPDPGVVSVNVGDLGSVRARIGYAWDRALLYGTGGWAWSSNTSSKFDSPGPEADAHFLSGYVLGGGLEYAFAPSLSIKAEYLYTHLQPTDFYTHTSNACPQSCTIGADVNTFLLGVNVRLPYAH